MIEIYTVRHFFGGGFNSFCIQKLLQKQQWKKWAAITSVLQWRLGLAKQKLDAHYYADQGQEAQTLGDTN